MNALYSFVILYSFLSAVFGSQEKCLPSTCTETTEISDLQTTSSNQDNSILTLNSQAAELGENVFDLYSEIGKLTDEIKTLKSKNKEHEAEIESLRKTVTEMEFFVDQLDNNTTTTESDVDDLETKTTTLMENNENLSSVVENLDLNYELLNESFSDFEERSSSLVRVFETTNPPEIGSIAVPALTCKWVQVFVDVASSAAHSKAYGLLYRDGYPINEGMKTLFLKVSGSRHSTYP